LIGTCVFRKRGKRGVDALQCARLDIVGRTKRLRRSHEIVEIADRISGKLVEDRIVFGRRAWRIAAQKAPHHIFALGIRNRGEIEEKPECDRQLGSRRLPRVNVPDRIVELLLGVLGRIGREELQVVVDGAGNDVEIELLRALRLLKHEQRQAFGRGICQPVLDGQPVAL